MDYIKKKKTPEEKESKKQKKEKKDKKKEKKAKSIILPVLEKSKSIKKSTAKYLPLCKVVTKPSTPI